MRFVATGTSLSIGRRAPSVQIVGVAFAIAAILAGCSKPSGPSEPDSRTGGFLGTWSGTVTSTAIGTGAATIVLDSQIGPDAFPLLTGSWRFVFSNPMFDATGTVSGNLNASGTILGLFFSRAAVPCPDEPGGVAQKAILATLTFSNNGMRGDYIVGGCPGGTLDLVRK